MAERLFYCLPIGALSDKRLTALDFRVLGVIALHDGMTKRSGKGAGCYASYGTLNKLVGCDYTNFSKSVSKLIKLEYLVREPQLMDKRKFTLRVLYPSPDSCSSDQLKSDEIAANLEKDVGPSTNKDSEIVGLAKTETPGNLPNPAEHYISSKEELDSVETGKNIPLSGAILKSRGLPEKFFELNVGAQLASFERAYEKNSCDFEADFELWESWLSKVSLNEFENMGPNYQRAERLLQAMESEKFSPTITPF